MPGDSHPPPPPPEGVNSGYKGGMLRRMTGAPHVELKDLHSHSTQTPCRVFLECRNLLVYWAAAFYRSSTNAPTVDFDPLLIHSQFCEEPCRWQEVLLLSTQTSMPLPRIDAYSRLFRLGTDSRLRIATPAGATRQDALNADKFGEDMTLHPHVFPRDTRPLRMANNGIPSDYRGRVLCPATEASCDTIFEAAPRFAPVFPRIDRSNEKREDLINDNTDLTDEQLQKVQSEGTDSLREPPSPPWRSNEHKRNPRITW